MIDRGDVTDPTAPVPSTVDRSSVEQMLGRPTSRDQDRSAAAIDPDPALPIGGAPRVDGPIGRPTAETKKERRSLDKLRELARELVAAQGWTPTQITAEALRINLRCSPNRARILRDELKPARAATSTDDAEDRDVA